MAFRHGNLIRVFGPTVALLATLWGLVVVWAQFERTEAISSNTQILSQLNSAIAEHSNGLLRLVEMALNAANSQMQSSPSGTDIATAASVISVAERLRQRSDGLLDLRLVRGDGTIDYIPPRADLPRPPVSDRDFATAQTQGGSPVFFVGKPIVGWASGKWLLPITIAPIRSADGSFLIALLDIKQLAALHDQHRMHAGGTIGLFRNDGTVLSRAPFDENVMRQSASRAPEFHSIWLKNERGAYISQSTVNDNRLRLISFIHLKDYPIFVYIGLQLDQILAPWRRRVESVVPVVAVVSVFTLIGAAYLARSLERSDENHRRFADVAETASDLVWEVNAEQRFTFISNRYRQVLELEERQILTHTLEELGWRPMDAVAAERFHMALAAQAPFTDVPFQLVRPGAPEKIAAVSGRAYFRKGRFRGYRGVMNDITERIRQERERRLRAEGEAKTSKLEALGQLAGGVAHDFNNLLGAILGFGQFLVQDSPPGSPQRRYAERVVMAGERGRELVQQILAFSRRTPGAPADIMVAEIVRETVELLKVTIPSTTALTVERDGGGVLVTADRSQLGQILINLCINASDALDGQPGEVRIAVAALDGDRPELKRLPLCTAKPTPTAQLTWTDEEGFDWVGTGGLTARDNVSIVVVDTGSGIPREHFDPLFDLFFTTKLNGGGTGLGLPVVQRVVTEHGGAILVRTKTGIGTVFEVILPRAAVAAPQGQPTDVVSDAPSRRKATVLVVDDDDDFCAMMQTALERLGHEVVSVGDPFEALAAVTEEPPLWDLVITDQTMPGMKGAELVRRIKAAAPAVRCIICTGYSSSLNEPQALAAGADAFRTKPVNLSNFATLVDLVLASNCSVRCAGALIADNVRGRLDSDES